MLKSENKKTVYHIIKAIWELKVLNRFEKKENLVYLVFILLQCA